MNDFIVPSGERKYTIHFSFDKRYKLFYNWLNTVKPEEDHTDFPRHYVTLSIEQENYMKEHFKENIYDVMEFERLS